MHRRRNKYFPVATVAQLRGISRWAFAGGAVWGRGLFWVFVGFPVVLYRKIPLFPGVCWISGSAVWGKASFSWHLCGICRWCYTGRGFFFLHLLDFQWCYTGRDLFPLVFLAFGSFGTGEGLLWYGICTRCAKTPSCGTRRIFMGTRCAEQASTVRNRYSVHENPLLRYARVVVCEYVVGYFRRTDNSLKLSATLSGDGIV